MYALLRGVLAHQVEDGRGAELTEERVRDVLLRRAAFTADEEYLLLTSPLARWIYAGVREDLRLNEEAALRQSREEALQRGRRIRRLQIAAVAAALVAII